MASSVCLDRFGWTDDDITIKVPVHLKPMDIVVPVVTSEGIVVVKVNEDAIHND